VKCAIFHSGRLKRYVTIGTLQRKFKNLTLTVREFNKRIVREHSNFKKKRIVKKLDVIAQNQNHFHNQGVEIVQKLSILCKQRNHCRGKPV
jgi:hypothetical protein